MFKHLALAAATGAFVGNDDPVVVRGNNLNRGTMHGDPLLDLADIQQHAIDALLGARAGIEVVAEQLVHSVESVMHDHLFSGKVRVAKSRGDINDRTRGKVRRNLVAAQNTLEQSQTQGKETAVGRRDDQCMGALLVSAGVEWEDGQRLR